MCNMGQNAPWISAVSLAVIAASGCFVDDRDTTACAAGAHAEAAASSEPLAIPEDASIVARRAVFAPCAEDAELECGQLSVPLDHANPRGEHISLATVRAPALTSTKKGVLFVNPGGPGGSGVDFVIFAKPLFASLLQLRF